MGTRVVLPHKHFDPAHLAEVTAQMQKLGPPTIRAVWDPNNQEWLAIEGSHRLRAAAALGLTPVIEEMEFEDEDAPIGEAFGWDDDTTVTELREDSWRSDAVKFSDLEGREG